METFLHDIAVGLVRDADAVRVEKTVRAEQDGGNYDEVILRLIVADDDKGRVIGKHGKIAKAIRTLVRAGAASGGKRPGRVTIDID